MGEYVCYLITIDYRGNELRCVLRTKLRPETPNLDAAFENAEVGDVVRADLDEGFSDPDFRQQLHDRLPLHVRSCGPIKHVETIFEAHDEERGGILLHKKA